MVCHQNDENLMQVVFKTGPDVLVLNGFENELDTVFVHTQIYYEFQYQR